jgi:hypothetical protein
MDENIEEYLKNLHDLELDPHTNWKEYGSLVKYLDYEWKENQKWDRYGKYGKGKWVSHQMDLVNMIIFPLVASEETKHDFMVFAEKVMGAKNAESV